VKNSTIIGGAIAAAVVLGGAGFGVAYAIAADHSGPEASHTSAPAETPTAGADAPSSSPTASTTPSVNIRDAAEVAQTVAGLFCRPNVDEGTWIIALDPYLSDDAKSKFSTTDPANVPCSKVTGAGKPVGDQQTGTLAAYAFPTDSGTLTVSLDRGGATFPWEVTYIIAG